VKTLSEFGSPYRVAYPLTIELAQLEFLTALSEVSPKQYRAWVRRHAWWGLRDAHECVQTYYRSVVRGLNSRGPEYVGLSLGRRVALCALFPVWVFPALVHVLWRVFWGLIRPRGHEDLQKIVGSMQEALRVAAAWNAENPEHPVTLTAVVLSKP